MKKRLTMSEVHQAAFTYLMDTPHHDVVEMYWESMTPKEKWKMGMTALGEEV